MKLLLPLFGGLAAAQVHVQAVVNGGFERSNSTIAPWHPERPIVHPGSLSPNAVSLTSSGNSIIQNITLSGPQIYSFRYKFTKGSAKTDSILATRIVSNGATARAGVRYSNFRNLTAGTESWTTVTDYLDVPYYDLGTSFFDLSISVALTSGQQVLIDNVNITSVWDNFDETGVAYPLQNPGFQSGKLAPGWKGNGTIIEEGEGAYDVKPFNIAQAVNLIAGTLYSVTFSYTLPFIDSYCHFANVGIAFGGVRGLQTIYGNATAEEEGFGNYSVSVIAQPGWTNLTVVGSYGFTGNKYCSNDTSTLVYYTVDNFIIRPAVYNDTNPNPCPDDPDSTC